MVIESARLDRRILGAVSKGELGELVLETVVASNRTIGRND